MLLPLPRGPLSQALFDALHGRGPVPETGPADDEDLQISLWSLYEQHYRGFHDVPSDLEWDPALLAVRQRLERIFESELRRSTALIVHNALAAGDLAAQLRLVTRTDGSSLASHVRRSATREQFVELITLRSVYHLKESDPAAWTLPRLSGASKVALAELQYDEYGAGRPEALHQRLYADAMDALGIDSGYGAQVDRAPAEVLAVNNAMSLFGLHRRLRGASLGHLAAFEMTSTGPSRRYVQGAQRLGLPDAVVRYFDEHVEADAVHEQVVVHDICGPLVLEEPDLLQDVLFGAATCMELENRASGAMLDAWSAGRSALRPGEAGEAPVVPTHAPPGWSSVVSSPRDRALR